MQHGTRPRPTVFLVHGGPAAADRDEWNPVRATWAASGFCVVQVNYRGSTGFGSDWLRANRGRPGEIELDDISTVRAHLVDVGVVDAGRAILVGRSWGGYLALLGAGLTPDLWESAIAIVPVGDTTLVYHQMLDEIRAAYRDRFGGDPSEVPDVYRRASPTTYVDRVRIPVRVEAARNDPRCPISQIDAWVDAARAVGVEVEYVVKDGGHASHVTGVLIDAMRAQLDFAARHIGRRGPPDHDVR